VCVCAGPLKSSVCMACRFRLAGSRYDERRSRADARLAFTGRTKQKSSGLQVQLRTTLREERGRRKARRADTDSDSGVPAGDDRECQRSTRFGEGSSRSEKVHGESASSTLEKASVSEVRRIAIG